MSWASVAIYKGGRGKPWEELVDDLQQAAAYLLEKKDFELLAVEIGDDGKSTGVVMRYEPEGFVHPQVKAWTDTAAQLSRNEEHYRKDRDKLLRLVYSAGNLKELQRDLTAEGYHRLIQPSGDMIGKNSPRVWVEVRGASYFNVGACFDTHPVDGVSAQLVCERAAEKYRDEGLPGLSRIPEGAKPEAFVDVSQPVAVTGLIPADKPHTTVGSLAPTCGPSMGSNRNKENK